MHKTSDPSRLVAQGQRRAAKPKDVGSISAAEAIFVVEVKDENPRVEISEQVEYPHMV